MYVDRDGSGKIVTIYSRPQRADHESVGESDPDLVAFRNKPVPSREDTQVNQNEAIINTIADLTGKTEAEAETAYRANLRR